MSKLHRKWKLYRIACVTLETMPKVSQNLFLNKGTYVSGGTLYGSVNRPPQTNSMELR